MVTDTASAFGKETWLIRDIVVGQIDSRGQKIERIYSKVRETFAIYLADRKIWIQYADEGRKSADGRDLGEDQRRALAPLRALRGQIDGLKRKLNLALHPFDDQDEAEIEYYNQRVSDALFNALQGNSVPASIELGEIRAELLDRLRSLGRLQFARSTLLATFITLSVLVAAVLFAARVDSIVTGDAMVDTAVLTFVRDNHLWAAGLFGSLGAWFSIALTLRKSDPQVSTNALDNLVDPVLRIVIAVIAASLLFTIVQLGLFKVEIGGVALDWVKSEKPRPYWYNLHVAIFLAFLAGFSERLVGNLLDSTVQTLDPTAARAAAGFMPDASEASPLGRGGASGGAAGSGAAAPGSAPLPEDDGPDPPPPDPATLETEIMPDDQLPPSTGGTEKPGGRA